MCAAQDHLVRLLELAVSTLFWWHPVAWWAIRELQQLEELCCDAMVVGMNRSSGRDYAATLLDTLDFLCDGSIAAPPGGRRTIISPVSEENCHVENRC